MTVLPSASCCIDCLDVFLDQHVKLQLFQIVIAHVEAVGNWPCLGCKLCSTVKAAQLTAPRGPEMEAVTHDAVNGESPLQVAQPLGHMPRPRALHHATCKDLNSSDNADNNNENIIGNVPTFTTTILVMMVDVDNGHDTDNDGDDR